MNENQQDARMAFQMAVEKVNIAANELAKARSALHEAEKALNTAIRHDPVAWYATPKESRVLVKP